MDPLLTRFQGWTPGNMLLAALLLGPTASTTTMLYKLTLLTSPGSQRDRQPISARPSVAAQPISSLVTGELVM
ncbi:Hypothetical predicted protein [Pelobates cultripes]|uniref:Uncharacterized protein n=1 Tax=Pelobates cultripes TaxID=61616 RepID=A0AAD1SRR4_PELCU|nr:Hypothetical predicted protein [Pelobates cultripes]